jgi:hypothetical protein
MFETVPKAALMTADIEFVTVAAVQGANDMLMRGFTSVRDVGGPVFGLKRGIDSGLAIGSRIWPRVRLFRGPADMAISGCPTNRRPSPGTRPTANGRMPR